MLSKSLSMLSHFSVKILFVFGLVSGMLGQGLTSPTRHLDAEKSPKRSSIKKIVVVPKHDGSCHFSVRGYLPEQQHFQVVDAYGSTEVKLHIPIPVTSDETKYHPRYPYSFERIPKNGAIDPELKKNGQAKLAVQIHVGSMTYEDELLETLWDPDSIDGNVDYSVLYLIVKQVDRDGAFELETTFTKPDLDWRTVY